MHNSEERTCATGKRRIKSTNEFHRFEAIITEKTNIFKHLTKSEMNLIFEKFHSNHILYSYHIGSIYKKELNPELVIQINNFLCSLIEFDITNKMMNKKNRSLWIKWPEIYEQDLYRFTKFIIKNYKLKGAKEVDLVKITGKLFNVKDTDLFYQKVRNCKCSLKPWQLEYFKICDVNNNR